MQTQGWAQEECRLENFPQRTRPRVACPMGRGIGQPTLSVVWFWATTSDNFRPGPSGCGRDHGTRARTSRRAGHEAQEMERPRKLCRGRPFQRIDQSLSTVRLPNQATIWFPGPNDHAGGGNTLPGAVAGRRHSEPTPNPWFHTKCTEGFQGYDSCDACLEVCSETRIPFLLGSPQQLFQTEDLRLQTLDRLLCAMGRDRDEMTAHGARADVQPAGIRRTG